MCIYKNNHEKIDIVQINNKYVMYILYNKKKKKMYLHKQSEN